MPAICIHKPKEQRVATRRSARLMKSAEAAAPADAPSVSAGLLNAPSSPKVASPKVASPTKVASPATVTATTVITTAATVSANNVYPLVMPEIVEASASTRTILLPSDYVPRRPRNPFIVFRGQFNAMMKAGRAAASYQGERQHEVSKGAGDAWHSLSKEQQKPFVDFALEEHLLFTKRFPEYKYLEKPRLLYSVEWSIDTDEMFVINDNGSIRYGTQTSGGALAYTRSKKTRRAGKKAASAPRQATPEAAVEEPAALYPSWHFGGDQLTGGYQDISVQDLPLPYLPYPLLPSAPYQEVPSFPIDLSSLAGPSSGPFPFDNAPMDPFLGHDYNPGPYAGSEFLPAPEVGLSSVPAGSETSYNSQFQPGAGSFLELLYSK